MTILLLLSSLALGLLLWSRRGSALDRAARELREARTQPGKRLRLASPDRPVEELLAQINGLLEDRDRRPGAARAGGEPPPGRSPTSPMTCASPLHLHSGLSPASGIRAAHLSAAAALPGDRVRPGPGAPGPDHRLL